MRGVIAALAGCAFCALAAAGLSAAQAGADQRPTFRSGIDLLEVAAVVRDAQGRIVTDLAQRDFTLLEVGVAQPIATFEHVTVPPRRAPDVFQEAGIRPDVSANDGAATGRVFVLLLDALHVSPQRSAAARNYARAFVEQHTDPGDLVAVVTPGGVASATQDFTSDRARLLAAIDRFAGVKLQSATLQREQEARAKLDNRDVALHGGRDPEDGERASAAQALTAALDRLATSLENVGGRRKALLLFSEGVDYNEMDIMGSVQRFGSAVADARQRAVGGLMRANVSLYAIDPRALSLEDGERIQSPERVASDRVNATGSSESTAHDFSNPGLEGEFETSIRNLRALAEPTGGFAAVNTNQFAGAFARIVEDSSDYYILGYAPLKPAKAREFRQIAVRVTRPGLVVNARRGYVGREARRPPAGADSGPDISLGQGRSGRTRVSDLPAASTPAPVRHAGLDGELSRLLASPVPTAGLPLRLQAASFKGSGRKAVVQLVIEIGGAALQFVQRDGRGEERIELALLTVSDQGRAENGRSTTIDLHLTPEQLARVRYSGVRWISTLDLEPGHYQLRVAGRAAASDRSGLLTADLDVPAFDAGRWEMSGLLLTSLPSALMISEGKTRLSEALTMPPSTARTFVAGDQITAALEAYPPRSGAEAAVSARLDSLADSRVIPVGTEKLDPGSKGPRPVAFAIDTSALRPGPYVLRISLQAPGAGSSRVDRAIPFSVMAH